MQARAIASVNGTSLIPETLEEMSTDLDFQETAARLQRLGQAAMTREEKVKRQRSLDTIGVPSFAALVKASWLPQSASLCIVRQHRSQVLCGPHHNLQVSATENCLFKI